MPAVFTIYNHGTDFHRDKDPTELVSQLSVATQGFEAEVEQTGTPSEQNPTPWRLKRPLGVSSRQFPTYLICEGPGSDEVSEEDSSSGVKHAHPGKYNPMIGGKKDTAQQNPLLQRPKPLTSSKREVRSFQDSFMGNTAKPFQTSGRISGSGWDDNVLKAVWLLTAFGDELPKTVNILGWSRGAVTCLKMANKLNEVFPQIEVNIFAVDPVPGGKDVLGMGPDTYTITPNIASYVAILAMHDHRQNFVATEIENLVIQPRNRPRPGGLPPLPHPDIIFLPLPGNHSDVVCEKEPGEQYPATAYSKKLAQFMAWKFLSANGTRFRQDMNMAQNYSAQKCCEMYENLAQNLDIIDRMAETSGLMKKHVIGGGYLLREVCANRGRYTPTPFLNLHHCHCHQQAYGSLPYAHRVSNPWPAKHPLQGNLRILERAGLCF